MIKRTILISSLFFSSLIHADHFKYDNINDLKNSNMNVDIKSFDKEVFQPVANKINSKTEKKKKRMIESNINGDVCLSISDYAYYAASNYYTTGISKPLFSRIIDASIYHDANSYIRSVPIAILVDLESEEETLNIFNQLKYKADENYRNDFRHEISLLFKYRQLYKCLIKKFPYYQYEDIDFFKTLKVFELDALEENI